MWTFFSILTHSQALNLLLFLEIVHRLLDWLAVLLVIDSNKAAFFEECFDWVGEGEFSSNLFSLNLFGSLQISILHSAEILILFLQNVLKGDDFYKIRLPSNVLSPPGREFIISSVKAVSSSLYKDHAKGLKDFIAWPRYLVFLCLVSSFWILLLRIFIIFVALKHFGESGIRLILKKIMLIKKINLTYSCRRG